MKIPMLKPSARSREYKEFNDQQRRAVVMAWLFDGKSTRAIDDEVLGLDSTESPGYKAMGILHYLGLTREFKGLFNGMSVVQGVDELRKADDVSYAHVIEVLSDGESFEEWSVQEDIESETKEVYEVQSEGKAAEYYSTRYERSSKNRALAIKLHGTKCMACGFDFEKVYGARRKNYIEVHHIIPLASRNAEVKVDPRTDLVVVCANCHRMIHRKKNQVLSLDELRKIIAENKV